MIYGGPGFLSDVWFGFSLKPLILPLSRQQVVSLSQSFCMSPIELTDGGGGQIIRRRESLVLCNHAIFSGKLCEWEDVGRTTSISVDHLPRLIAAETVRRSLGCCSTTLYRTMDRENARHLMAQALPDFSAINSTVLVYCSTIEKYRGQCEC